MKCGGGSLLYRRAGCSLPLLRFPDLAEPSGEAEHP